MPPTKKPTPISRKLSKKPAAKKAAPTPEHAPQAFNDISQITAKQMARAERGIDVLREEIKELRNRKQPTVKVTTPEPKVVVELPPRPRIMKVTVTYDNFGIPKEFVPVYSEI